MTLKKAKTISAMSQIPWGGLRKAKRIEKWRKLFVKIGAAAAQAAAAAGR